MCMCVHVYMCMSVITMMDEALLVMHTRIPLQVEKSVVFPSI